MPKGVYQHKKGYQRQNFEPWNKGLTKETDYRIMQYANNETGRILSDETKSLQSLRAKERWADLEYIQRQHSRKQNPEYIEKRSKILKEYWADPVWAERQMIRCLEGNKTIRPNKPEKILIDLLEKSSFGDISYTGNGSFWIGGRNPDFVNTDKKVVIELLGCFWHGCHKHYPDKVKQDEVATKIKLFKRYGYATLEVWECELRNPEKLIAKIRRSMEVQS